MKHPAKIKGFRGSMQDAAQAIAAMRYDSIRELFEALAVEFKNEAEKDKQAGRIKLYVQLQFLASAMWLSVDLLDRIWEICEKHMEPRQKK